VTQNDLSVQVRLFNRLHDDYRPRWSSGSVLATGPKVRGFKPGRGRWILRVIQSAERLPSEGKQSRQSHVIDLRHVKEPYAHDRCSSAKFSGHVSHPRFTCSATRRCLLALLTDVPCGRIRWLITPHLIVAPLPPV
jgi:hypothetical protein